MEFCPPLSGIEAPPEVNASHSGLLRFAVPASLLPMDWGTSQEQFVVVQHAGYLHVTTKPGLVIDLPGMELVYAFIQEECRARNCRRVLVESHIAARKLGKDGAAESSRLLARYAQGLRLAVWLQGHQPDELTANFEHSASQDGVTIRLFTDQKAAVAWLESDVS